MHKSFSIVLGLASSLFLIEAATHCVWAEPNSNCIYNYRACVGSAGGVDVDRSCKKDYDDCLAKNPGKNDGGKPKPGTARTIDGAVGSVSYGASSNAVAAPNGTLKGAASASTSLGTAPARPAYSTTGVVGAPVASTKMK